MNSPPKNVLHRDGRLALVFLTMKVLRSRIFLTLLAMLTFVQQTVVYALFRMIAPIVSMTLRMSCLLRLRAFWIVTIAFCTRLLFRGLLDQVCPVLEPRLPIGWSLCDRTRPCSSLSAPRDSTPTISASLQERTIVLIWPVRLEPFETRTTSLTFQTFP